VPNVARSPRVAYELDPEATLDAIEGIEAANEEVVGFYHSHPAGPPRPSATDRARATWPGYVYVIVVPGDDPTTTAWRWTGETFDRLSIDLVDDRH
jgi:proteasome lid subunit RPN8/RPN11